MYLACLHKSDSIEVARRIVKLVGAHSASTGLQGCVLSNCYCSVTAIRRWSCAALDNILVIGSRVRMSMTLGILSKLDLFGVPVRLRTS